MILRITKITASRITTRSSAYDSHSLDDGWGERDLTIVRPPFVSVAVKNQARGNPFLRESLPFFGVP
jgi:hypothetical protein